jgi:hypothetical protein
MKPKNGLKIATWIMSLGMAFFAGAMAAILVMAFFPSPGTGAVAILLSISIGLGVATFGAVWFVYWAVLACTNRKNISDQGEQKDGE